MKSDYERQAIELSDSPAQLNAERAEQLANGFDQRPALMALAKCRGIEKLTCEILVDLVDHIKI